MFKPTKIHDISLPITAGMLVYPNNAIPEFEWYRTIPQANSNLSKLTLGSHTGTHADAPLHTNAGGQPIDRTPVENFFGPALVVDCTSVPLGRGVTAADLQDKGIKAGLIVLLKTRNSKRGYDKFYEDFVYLEPDGAQYLSSKRVKAVGIDYLAIQKYHSGNVTVHRELLDKGITIFEGLNLSPASEGTYLFCCLPLNVVGAEAAPARAILIEGG